MTPLDTLIAGLAAAATTYIEAAQSDAATIDGLNALDDAHHAVGAAIDAAYAKFNATKDAP